MTPTLDRPTQTAARSASPPRPPAHRMTFAEYMEHERLSEAKHDLIDGVMVPVWPVRDAKGEPVSGATSTHNTISANITIELGIALRGTRCRVLTSNQKIYINNRTGYYPDVTVVCGELRLAFVEALQNPVLIVEVLSPSTERRDRTTKWGHYQAIESLQHYALIDQYKPLVTWYERGENGAWLAPRTVGALTDTWRFVLNQTPVAISLREVYAHIAFDADGAAEGNP